MFSSVSFGWFVCLQDYSNSPKQILMEWSQHGPGMNPLNPGADLYPGRDPGHF